MSQQKTSGLLNTKIVVSKVYRPEILHLAHETPMSGYLGVNKTYHKSLNLLYRPGLKSNVSHFLLILPYLSDGRKTHPDNTKSSFTANTCYRCTF